MHDQQPCVEDPARQGTGKTEVSQIPPLAECREAFAKLMRQDFEWGGPEEWREEPPPDVEAGGPIYLATT